MKRLMVVTSWMWATATSEVNADVLVVLVGMTPPRSLR